MNLSSTKRLLGVNIDHVATLREARKTPYPSIVEAAREAVAGGADQITIHLREDRRHIQDQDLYDLKKIVTVPLNLEMAVSEEIINIALDVQPATATLVPERRQELTTEGGLDCTTSPSRLKEAAHRLKRGGITVSFFIDPEARQIEMAKELGGSVIELHTGAYCEADTASLRKSELERLKKAALFAKVLDLKVAAGHGLHYKNTAELVAFVPEITEYNIGHAIVARSVFVGLKNAVIEMKEIIEKTRL